MNILILAQHYAPEEVSGAVLATELAEDLVKSGHQVTFVTCAPNYPHGRIFTGYRNRLICRENRNGVTIIRVWSYVTSTNLFWLRILNFGTFSIMAFFGALFAQKPQVVFSYSPPLPLGLSAWLFSRIRHIPWILRVEDLYPEAAIAAGVFKNRLTIRFFTAIERFLYQKASHISLISEGFRQNLLGKSISTHKLSVIPVWADPDLIQPLPKETVFRQQYNLQQKFVVLYAGNMGTTSALEEVITAAKILEQETEIQFVFVGEGIKKEELIQQARRLPNVLFLPYQPRQQLAEILASADASLVTLNSTSASFSLPNKIFNIMASARPVLAIVPEHSEVSALIKTAACGISVTPNNPRLLAEAIQQLKNNPDNCNRMGANARAFLETQASRHKCISAFDQLFQQITGWSK